MTHYLRLERIPYEEPYHVELVWDVSNGITSSCFRYYANADFLREIAERLEVFPRHSRDVFLYEIGSEKPEDRFAYYFRLRVFTTDSLGGSAIQIRFCNNEELPSRQVVEFCIETDPGAVNRLGELFREFAKLEHTYMAWSDSESFIGSRSDYA